MIYLKQNDRLPAATTVLKRGETVVTDLDTATSITFVMRQIGRVTNKVSGLASVVDAPNGAIKYEWADGDTDIIGNFRVSWVVLWPGALEETFPTIGYNLVHIDPSLED